MESQTCLTNHSKLIVVDSSVVINLNASRCIKEILNALPNKLVFVDLVLDELERGKRKGLRKPDDLSDLILIKKIKVVTLGEVALGYFENMVTGTAIDSLDDGEAATIAYAIEHNSIALIDERKAIRICSEVYPALHIGCTVDIFMHPNVQKSLGSEGLADAVWYSLQEARMRVLPHHLDWVVKLIGEEKAVKCNSLPKSLRSQVSPSL